MSKKLILKSKAYLVILGENKEFEAGVISMSERLGFRILKAENAEDAQELLEKIQILVGIVNLGKSDVLPLLPHHRESLIAVHSSADVQKCLFRLDEMVCSKIPARLCELINNAIVELAPKLLGKSFHGLTRNSNYNIKFTNLVTCDTSAAGFSGKASCEANFSKLRQNYPEMKNKTDLQLVDLFGEFCNQLLGVVNYGLRPLGLSPLISLPIGAELSGKGQSVSQVEFMPMVRIVDRHAALSVGFGVKIDPGCDVRWSDLSVRVHKGKVEFF